MLREVFRGQNGVVFQAKQKSSENQVALKMRTSSELGPRKSLYHEASLLKNLDHKNVIKLLGTFFDVSKNALVLVLEWMDGGDLFNHILSKRVRMCYFNENTIWSYISQIAEGVRYLHSLGIVHRDLKALNLFLSRDHTTLKIGDLGVSRQMSQDTLLLQSRYGTPLYLSPEMILGEPYNEKTDIWAVGVVLYELLTLTNPFSSSPSLAVLSERVLTGRMEPPLPVMYSRKMRAIPPLLLEYVWSCTFMNMC